MEYHQQVAPHDGLVTNEETPCRPLIFTLSQFICIFRFFQGSDIFVAKINIEVQRATEGAIAAIERNGGIITNSFYDPISLGK